MIKENKERGFRMKKENIDMKKKPEEKKLSREDLIKITTFIDTLNPIIGLGIINLSLFETVLKQMEDAYSTHQAIGFIASGYEIKQKEYKFRIERMKAVVNLLKVYLESQEEIAEIELMKKQHNNIEKIFGL